jgi:cytochrome P450
MDKWIPYFTWDVIGNLTLGSPMGYLKHGSDFDGMQETGDSTFFYFAVVGQIPELDYWLVKNPLVRIGPPAFDGPAAMCAKRIAERQKEFEAAGEATHEDMLEDFMRVNREDPTMMDDNAVVVALMVNVLAGGDTTGVLCCAIMYYVLKNPHVYKKLMEELNAANLVCPVSYASTEKLRYFDAVVKEAARMHPGVGLMLERIVPAEGLTLKDGRTLKPGTVVGMNAWVIHQNKEIFGEDAAVFNPDRWLRGKVETEEVC